MDKTDRRRTDALPWTIVQSQACSHSDRANPVFSRLLRHGFRPFNPRFRNRQVDPPQQLFPGYMFVSGADGRWSALKGVDGVHRILMTGPERPVCIGDEFVDGLRSSPLDEEGVILLGRGLRPRQRVVVTGGTFLDSIGIYEGMRQRDRVSVLVKVLGRSTRVFVREGNLVAA